MRSNCMICWKTGANRQFNIADVPSITAWSFGEFPKQNVFWPADPHAGAVTILTVTVHYCFLRNVRVASFLDAVHFKFNLYNKIVIWAKKSDSDQKITSTTASVFNNIQVSPLLVVTLYSATPSPGAGTVTFVGAATVGLTVLGLYVGKFCRFIDDTKHSNEPVNRIILVRI